MSVIEIEGIAELLNCSRSVAWKIVGNKNIWTLTHCGYRLVKNKKKRCWDAKAASKEVGRINMLKRERNWRSNLVNHSYVMMNTPVRKFPANSEIRAYLIEKKGIAEYRAYG